MSNVALAYSTGRSDPRRARALRRSKSRSVHQFRSWSEVSIAGTPLQATSGYPSHINRWKIAALIAAALVLHATLAWYFHSGAPRAIEARKADLNIELVRPPTPPEPPKVEPPKPVPPRVQPQQAQVLPQIQEATQESALGEATEAIAVAPIVSAPPAPEPQPVTAPIGHAGYLNNPAPDYPAVAVRQRWEGTVLLRVRVLSDGKVDSVEIKRSSGRKVLDDEAIRTVRQWLFTPSKRGDTPIDGWANVPIEFLLS
jgi:protein TonB